MLFIPQIYNKLCKIFGRLDKNIDIDDNQTDDFNIIFSIDIDKNYNRHYSIYIPDNIDSDKVLILSEAYAKTLLDISSIKIVQQLIHSLNSSIDKDDPIQQIFADTVIKLFVEYSSIKLDSSEPMIQPLSVFSK